MQTAEKLENVDININVLTIEEFYEYGSDDDLVILDEYDILIDDYPFTVANSGLRGIWELKDRKVIAFSATSSLAYERLISNCVVKPVALKFKSEYEMINGFSPISHPTIQSCGSSEGLM